MVLYDLFNVLMLIILFIFFVIFFELLVIKVYGVGLMKFIMIGFFIYVLFREMFKVMRYIFLGILVLGKSIVFFDGLMGLV